MQISKINNNNVNFRSNINLIDSRKYFKVTEKLDFGVSFVNFPWTPKDIVKGQRAITEDIKSCTAGGIIVEGINKIREVVMFHLNPDLDDCKDFNKVEKALTEKIGTAKPLQAFMVGSKKDDSFLKYSGEYFDDLWKNVISKFNVPTSFLKGIPMGGHLVDLCCDAPNDTWYVSCSVRDEVPRFSSSRKSFTGFDVVQLSEKDHLTFD